MSTAGVLRGDPGSGIDSRAIEALCEFCGAAPALAPGRRCRPCVEFAREHERSAIHFCGGCGASFLVDRSLTVKPVDIDGVRRIYCACCQDFLGERIASPNMARTPGFDEEGQRILARVEHQMPTASRRRRDRELQASLARILVHHAVRAGVELPTPLFLVG